MTPKTTSTTVNHQPTAPAVISSRLGFYTLLAIALAIIALFTPILLRGQTLRPQFLGSQLSRYFSSPTSPITTTTDTMSEVKLSPRDLKEWNHLAEGMDRYHTHFRYEFNRVYKLADGSFHKEGMNLNRFMREAAQLSTHLDMHHRIEAYIFPLLAKKMPQFKAGAREAGEHLKSHKAIHDGLDKYDKFLKEVQETPSSYNPDQLRAILDSFRDVLFRHLDEEVEDLGGESLRKAGFTLKELKQIPM